MKRMLSTRPPLAPKARLAVVPASALLVALLTGASSPAAAIGWPLDVWGVGVGDGTLIPEECTGAFGLSLALFNQTAYNGKWWVEYETYLKTVPSDCSPLLTVLGRDDGAFDLASGGCFGETPEQLCLVTTGRDAITGRYLYNVTLAKNYRGIASMSFVPIPI